MFFLVLFVSQSLYGKASSSGNNYGKVQCQLSYFLGNTLVYNEKSFEIPIGQQNLILSDQMKINNQYSFTDLQYDLQVRRLNEVALSVNLVVGITGGYQDPYPLRRISKTLRQGQFIGWTIENDYSEVHPQVFCQWGTDSTLDMEEEVHSINCQETNSDPLGESVALTVRKDQSFSQQSQQKLPSWSAFLGPDRQDPYESFFFSFGKHDSLEVEHNNQKWLCRSPEGS